MPKTENILANELLFEMHGGKAKDKTAKRPAKAKPKAALTKRLAKKQDKA